MSNSLDARVSALESRILGSTAVPALVQFVMGEPTAAQASAAALAGKAGQPVIRIFRRSGRAQPGLTLTPAA